jgi:hypothetical protein
MAQPVGSVGDSPKSPEADKPRANQGQGDTDKAPQKVLTTKAPTAKATAKSKAKAKAMPMTAKLMAAKGKAKPEEKGKAKPEEKGKAKAEAKEKDQKRDKKKLAYSLAYHTELKKLKNDGVNVEEAKAKAREAGRQAASEAEHIVDQDQKVASEAEHIMDQDQKVASEATTTPVKQRNNSMHVNSCAWLALL